MYVLIFKSVSLSVKKTLKRKLTSIISSPSLEISKTHVDMILFNLLS